MRAPGRMAVASLLALTLVLGAGVALGPDADAPAAPDARGVDQSVPATAHHGHGPTPGARTARDPAADPHVHRSYAHHDDAALDPETLDLVPPAQRLDADTTEAVIAAAVQWLRADLTGDGMAEGTARPCCRQLVVHDVVAARHPDDERRAVVLVTWSATRRDTGAPISQVTTRLVLAATGSGWTPVEPGAEAAP